MIRQRNGREERRRRFSYCSAGEDVPAVFPPHEATHDANAKALTRAAVVAVMLVASAYGRLGADPVKRVTKNCKPWAIARVALNVCCRYQDEDAELLQLAAFGRAAEALLKDQAGDLGNTFGELTRQTSTDPNCNEHISWQPRVEDLLSTRTPRPGGGRKRNEQTRQQQPRPPVNDVPNYALPPWLSP